MRVHDAERALLCVVLGVMVSACQDKGRQSVSVPIEVVPSSAEVSGSEGAVVRLTEASVSFADLHLYGPSASARVYPSVFIRPAHAHPGHSAAGDLSGELLGSWTVDLLGETVALGEARCWEGEVATGSLELVGVASLVGEATVDGQVVPFAFAPPLDASVGGIAVGLELDADSEQPTLQLAVDLSHVLSFVRWNTEDDDSDGVLTTADGELGNTVPFGLQSTAAYSLTP